MSTETVRKEGPEQFNSKLSSDDSYPRKEDASKRRIRRRVSFSDLQIREYPRTVGDHPGALGRDGPPVSIDWKHVEEHKVSVDEYEARRQPRRSKEQLIIPGFRRRQILMQEWGCKYDELKVAEKTSQKIILQRQMTFAMLPWSEMEELYQSVKRKTTRLMRRRSSEALEIYRYLEIKEQVQKMSLSQSSILRNHNQGNSAA